MPHTPLVDALRKAADAVGLEQALAVALAGELPDGAPEWQRRLVAEAALAPGEVPEAYARLSPDRVERGAFYTPAPLVELAHRLLADAVPGHGIDPAKATLVDPACGAGGFFASPLAAAYARRLGVDRDASALAMAATRADKVFCGDAYAEGLRWLLDRVRETGGPVVVVGNPPYLGNSALLKSDAYLEVRKALLPFDREVPRGTSLRDDYVLFFGLADRLVEAAGAGGIAFVTSASFLSNYLYRPLRRHLLARYRLAACVELGPGFFEGSRADTALTVWLRARRSALRQRFRCWDVFAEAGEPASRRVLRLALVHRAATDPNSAAWRACQPYGKALLLRTPPEPTAAVLDAMREKADPVGRVAAFSTSGLKTRFDELLVAEGRAEIEERMRAFLRPDMNPSRFARAFDIPDDCLAKLEALAVAARKSGATFEPRCVRRFVRYAGPRHRFGVPGEAWAWVYFDRRLIPRGDHRLRGEYDPHLGQPKLVFNAREVPLAAAVVEREGCVHDYRHSRFAPLHVPSGLIGKPGTGRTPTGPLVPNFAPWWRRAAGYLGGELRVFDFLSGVVNSALVQQVFAPWLGASEEVPIRRVTTRNAATARTIVNASRLLRRQAEEGEALSSSAVSELDRAVDRLYGVR